MHSPELGARKPDWVSGALLSSVLLGLSLLLSVTSSPAFYDIGRDSGVYLYGGWQLLQGKLPYVDFWDHKPPLIFVLNALGLAMGIGRWGVWGVETLLFAISLTVLYLAARRRLGTLPAFLGTLVILFAGRNDSFFHHGNYPEGYAMCFSMLLLAGLLHEGRGCVVWALMGSAAGLVFLTKQTCIGLPAAVGLVLAWSGFIRRDRRFRRFFAAYLGGAASVLIVAVALMGALGILSEFWDASFVYSRIYVEDVARQEGALRRWWRTIWYLECRGVLSASILCMLGCVLRLLLGKAPGNADRGLPCAAAILIAIPLELTLISLPYRFYGNYFLSLFPLIGLGFSIWMDTVARMAPRFARADELSKVRKMMGAIAYCLPFLTLSGPLGMTSYKDALQNALLPKHRDAGGQLLSGPRDQDEILDYLKAQPADAPLLMWGAEARLNFLSRRASPTRYCYMLCLIHKDYDQQRRFREFLAGLEGSPASLIIDTMIGTAESLSPAATSTSNVAEQTPDQPHSPHAIPSELMKLLRDRVALRYRQDRVFRNGWIAYVPKAGR